MPASLLRLRRERVLETLASSRAPAAVAAAVLAAAAPLRLAPVEGACAEARSQVLVTGTSHRY